MRTGLLLIALLLSPAAALAADAGVPAENQAALLLRILAYDRKLPERAGDDVTLLLVYRSGNDQSEALKKELEKALTVLADRTAVADRRVTVRAHAWTSPQDLEAALLRHHVSALYVAPGLDERVPEISRTTRAQHVLSFSSDEALVNAGVSIALVRDGTRASIVVNLPSAKAEGAELDAGLLRICKVLR